MVFFKVFIAGEKSIRQIVWYIEVATKQRAIAMSIDTGHRTFKP